MSLAEDLQADAGPVSLSDFLGTDGGLPCTQWIARCSAAVLRNERPDLTLVYLPHLDYDTQRFGPAGLRLAPAGAANWMMLAAALLEAAQTAGARVWVVNEYVHVPVSQAVEPNRALRRAGLLRRPAGRLASSSTPSRAGLSRYAIIRLPTSMSRKHPICNW